MSVNSGTPEGFGHHPEAVAAELIAEKGAAARIIVEEVYGPGEPEEWQLDNARAALSRIAKEINHED